LSISRTLPETPPAQLPLTRMIAPGLAAAIASRNALASVDTKSVTASPVTSTAQLAGATVMVTTATSENIAPVARYVNESVPLNIKSGV